MRLTRPGAVIIAIVVACGVVVVVAGGWARFVAGLVGLLILLALAGEGLGGTGYGGDARRKQEVLTRQARPRRSRRRRDPG
jgi:hypothetical protein